MAVGGTLISLASDLALSKLDLLRRGRVPANLKNHTIVIGSGGMIDAVVNKLIRKLGLMKSMLLLFFLLQKSWIILPFLTPKTCTAASKIVGVRR